MGVGICSINCLSQEIWSIYRDMKHNLSILEKILIRYQTAADRNQNGIYEYVHQASGQSIILSKFISNELAQYDLDVRYLFHRRFCVVSLRAEDGKPYRRLMRRSDALDLLDIQIAQQEASIREIALRSDFELQELKKLRENAHQTASYHWEEKYKRDLAEKENQLKDEVSQHYLSVKHLLGEKQRLLETAFSDYDVLRGKKLVRIQYGYGVSCGNNLSIGPLKMTDYDPVIDNSIPDYFHAELIKTQEKLSAVANTIQEFQQTKKEG